MHKVSVVVAALCLLPCAQALAQEAISLRRPTGIDEPPPTGSTVTVRRKLAPIVISPAIAFNYDGDQTSILPRIHGEGERYLRGNAEAAQSLLLQFRINLNPKPGAGDAEQVAENIRTLDGTLGANLGLRFSYFPDALNKPTDEGSLGVDLRLGGNFALQTANTLSLDSGILSSSTFGLGTAEASVSVWLFWVYAGLQYSYYGAFGDLDPALDAALSGQAGLSGTLIYPIELSTATLQDGAVRTQTLYIQARITGKQDFSNSVIGLSIVGAFQPL